MRRAATSFMTLDLTTFGKCRPALALILVNGPSPHQRSSSLVDRDQGGLRPLTLREHA